MLKNLVFDMGQVLIHWEPEKFLDRLCVDDKKDRELLKKHIFESVEWILADWGELDEKTLEKVYVKPNIPSRLHSIAHELIFNWDKPLSPMEGMGELIKKYKARGAKIYLLSNASSRLHEYFERIPSHELFDGVVVSADIKLMKPQPEIYRYLLNSFSLNPKESIFIDDRLVNIAGAIREGMSGFHFTNNAVKELDEYLEERV